MGAAYFYHLTRRPLPETLRTLLEKSLQQGWRVSVRGVEAEGLEALDRALWLGAEDGFLPHGIAGGAHDTDQPVLLTLEREAGADRDCVMSVHGAEVSAAEVARLARVCVLFDGSDAAAVARARRQWTALKEAGVAAQYWSEDSGRWEKKAET